MATLPSPNLLFSSAYEAPNYLTDRELKNFENQLFEQSKAIGAAATQQSQTPKKRRGFHEIMGSLDPQTFAAYTSGLIAPPYDVEEPPRARDLSPEQNKALQEYYDQNRGSANPAPIPDWLYSGKEYLKPSENQQLDFSEANAYKMLGQEQEKYPNLNTKVVNFLQNPGFYSPDGQLSPWRALGQWGDFALVIDDSLKAQGPAPGFEGRAPANEFLENYKEEVAGLPPGPKGFVPPSEIYHNQILPMRIPGSSLNDREFTIDYKENYFKQTGPGLSREEQKTNDTQLAHIYVRPDGTVYSTPNYPLEKDTSNWPSIKDPVPEIKWPTPGINKGGQGRASVEDGRFESAIATASKASDIQKAQGAFGSEYDPQKARAAAQAADEYRRSAKTEDPFRSAAANADPFRSSAFG